MRRNYSRAFETEYVVKLLGFGDAHIKPAGDVVDYDHLQVPADVDLVVAVGDVIHRTGESDLDAGREFFRRLDAVDVPVVCVPGNHDPHEHYDALLEGCSTVVNAHDRVVSALDLEARASLGDLRIVGWGCEQFSFEPEIRYDTFPALDPRTDAPVADRRHAADRAASILEGGVGSYVRGERSAEALVDEWGIAPENRPRFVDQLAACREAFETIVERVPDEGSTLVLSHVPPFNTGLDRHHSRGTREADREGLHWGSITLKLALLDHRPLAALSGHSHERAYELGPPPADRPHMLGLGYRGVVEIDLDPATDGFGYRFY